MKELKLTFLTLLILVAGACSGPNQVKKTSPSLKAYLGGSHGGIIENTDLSLIPPVEPDAFSGATKVGVQAGLHSEYPLRHISLESGIDGILNSQTFTYRDDLAGFHGTRDFLVSQLRIPMAVNFRFLRKKHEDGLFQVKLGLSPGFCFYSVKDHGQTLPSHEKYLFTLGPLLGTDIIPWHFTNGSSLGISLEAFRSFQKVYDDYYQPGEEPGLSYLKFGFVYRFKK